MGRIRVLGETTIKMDYTCPNCGKIAKKAGTKVEIIEDMDAGVQLAAFGCDFCKERILAK